jgi:DNA-binding NarL/FixJ family response regulator
MDDEPMVCAHLRTILGAADDLEVVGEAHDGAAAVEAVLRDRPDVVLMDLRMPGVDGLTAIERINRLSDPPAVVALTTFDAEIAARLYLSEATVKGYVSRMLDKLGCANRTQAGLLAHDAGIVGPSVSDR